MTVLINKGSMLTQNEKDILGAMVDMGHLKGELRVAVGADDTLAREKIAEFKDSQSRFLPMQISSLIRNKENIEAELLEAESLMQLLVENN